MFNMLFDAARRFNAWSLLAQPVTPPQSPRIQLGSVEAFDTLSNEVLEKIIEHIKQRVDAIALGISCEGLW
jgi:hypothetical protein